MKVVKNKVAPPFRQAEFDIEYGEGISKEGCLLDLALEHDLIQKSGLVLLLRRDCGWARGATTPRQYLRQNPKLAAELEQKIHKKLGDAAAAKAEARDAQGPEAKPTAKARKTEAKAEPKKPEKAAQPAKAESAPQKKAA